MAQQMNDDVIRALLCEKAELIKLDARTEPGVEKDVIRMSIDSIDGEVNKARARLCRKQTVVVLPFKRVG